jgi:hypothetical protein
MSGCRYPPKADRLHSIPGEATEEK